MSYFITRKMFLTPSFELNVKEEEKLLKFLMFLEKSNVSSIINKYIGNNKGKGRETGKHRLHYKTETPHYLKPPTENAVPHFEAMPKGG